MVRLTKLLVLFVCAVFACCACNRISLSGSSGSGGGSSGGGGFSLPAINLGGNQPPPMTGEWHLTFVYNDQEHETNINFQQNGKTLAGSGTDDSGMQFLITNGTVDGTKVHFLKKYADSDPSKQPVDYTGELTYSDDNEFKGWSLGGHYKTNISGSPVDGKFVAVSAATEAANAQRTQGGGQQQAQQPEQQPVAQQPEQQPEQQGGGEQTGDQQGGEVPESVQGTYTAHYDFNFKRIECKLWLKQDGDKVSGDGIDTNTGEYFVVSKGACHAPRVVLTLHYEKGKHAANTRDLTIRAVLGPGPSLKGETQYGSPWTAHSVVR